MIFALLSSVCSMRVRQGARGRRHGSQAARPRARSADLAEPVSKVRSHRLDGVLARARPEPVVSKINGEVSSALKLSEVRSVGAVGYEHAREHARLVGDRKRRLRVGEGRQESGREKRMKSPREIPRHRVLVEIHGTALAHLRTPLSGSDQRRQSPFAGGTPIGSYASLEKMGRAETALRHA